MVFFFSQSPFAFPCAVHMEAGRKKLQFRNYYKKFRSATPPKITRECMSRGVAEI